MKTRNGKIARLPKPIREQLNQRLENGELGTSLVQWLNQQPEVQKIITEQFSGLPIRPQNLSEWRKGGYLEWIRHQLLREQTRWTAEQATDLNSDTDARTMSIAEDVAMIMSAELALQVQALGNITDPKERFEQFRILLRELSRLRRDDHRAVRINHRREQWRYDHPQEEAAPEQCNEKPNAGGASVPASRSEVINPQPYIPSNDDLNRLRLAALFRQQAATPQNPATSASVPANPPDAGDDTTSFKPYIPSIEDLKRLRDAAACRNAATPQNPETSNPQPQSAAAPVPSSTLDPTPGSAGISPAQAVSQLETPNPKPETIAKQAPYNPPFPALPSPFTPRPLIAAPPSAPIRPNPA